MKRGLLVVLVIAGVSLWAMASPPTQTLREELEIQEKMLTNSLVELEELEGRLQGAWVRMERELGDLLRAQEQEESLESLRLRDQDLRQAEAELMMHVHECQRLRRSIITTRMEIEETTAKVRELEGRVGRGEDPLSGTWRLMLEPGGQEGFLSLELDGTLVQGTYQLSGGWSGSMRGTLVAGKVRLERIDSQIGFAAIFYARLLAERDPPRLEGRWEATQLSSGLPSSGTWLAERLEELED